MQKFKFYGLISLSIFLCNSLFAQHVWQENTYQDFADGLFNDAGANMYVSAKGTIQMINRWDLNGDSHIDILCVNSHPLVEMLDMSIYWGNGKDYSIKNHSYVPANGPMWVTPGDLDDDGEMDLVVANYSNGTWTDMESFIYYGGLKNRNKAKSTDWEFSPFKERLSLPSSSAQKAVIADLNNDGFKDIVFAFSGGFWEYRDKNKKGSSPSRIYWGSAVGFDPQRFSNIATVGATDAAAGDLNNDDWIDLVFANGTGDESFIYYGSQNGFSNKSLQTLPTKKAHAVAIGDVDNNKSPDIVFANESGESLAYLNVNGSFNKKNILLFETHTAKDVLVEDFNNDGFNDLFFSNHQFSLSGRPGAANRLIDSYLYYGSRDGFSLDNRQSIQTIGAWGANAADLNNDGWTDLLVCNFQEHYSYEVPSFIYWNGPAGFTTSARTPLYEHGAQGNAIADFDGDGTLDVLITSMMGNSRGDYDPSFLYWGSNDGQYSSDNRLELPGREAYEQAFADLDDDGQVDIVLLNRGEVTRQNNEAWIYWNSQNQFSTWQMSGLPSYGALGVEVADLDRNGYLDIIISNGNAKINKDNKPDPGSFIYWGSAAGWPVTERSELPIVQTRATAVCDINRDGHLDLVFGQQGKWGEASIFFGDGSKNYSEKRRTRIKGSAGAGTPGVADLNKDGLLDIAFAHDKNVLIYHQDHKGGFPLSAAVKIPVMAKTMCVADVNADGWLDLVCPFYKGQGKRSWFSTVLLGSKDGYDLERSLRFPTDGATGSIVSDFNNDGFQDVFFFCHRADGSFDETGKFGDHHTNSLIYWGSQNGFADSNRLEIPSVGVHYDVGIDIGHINDRSFIYEYTSSVYFAQDKQPSKINWQALLPPRTAVRFQMRFANSKEGIKKALWLGPQGKDSYYTKSGSAINNIPAKQFIQYKVYFDTGNGASSPVLQNVTITMH